jgi:membrane protein implicated in regulation of membrane protease activity
MEDTSYTRLEEILRKRQKTDFAYKAILALVIGQFAFLNIFAANQFASLAIKAYGDKAVASLFGVQLNVGIFAMVLFSFVLLLVLVRFTGDRMKQEKEIGELLSKKVEILSPRMKAVRLK